MCACVRACVRACVQVSVCARVRVSILVVARSTWAFKSFGEPTTFSGHSLGLLITLSPLASNSACQIPFPKTYMEKIYQNRIGNVDLNSFYILINTILTILFA